MPAQAESHNQLIAIVVPSLGGGGAERMAVDLANEMDAAGVRVAIITARRAGLLSADLTSTVSLTELGAAGVIASIPRLARLLRRTRPAAIISMMDHTNLATYLSVRLARVSTRLIFTTHADFDQSFRPMQPWLRQVVIWAYGRICRHAHACVAVSNGVAESLARGVGVPRENVEVIYNGVSLARCTQGTTKHRRSIDEPLIVAMGRLTSQKGFDTLICAFAIVRREFTRARLKILGEGMQRAELELQLIRLGLTECVELPGYLRDPFPVLANANVFVLASRWEGFGLSIVEAMMLGVPVVSTDCRSGPAEILDGGKYGRLVAPDDANALALGIIEALQDPGPVEAAQCHARLFDIATVARRYIGLAGVRVSALK